MNQTGSGGVVVYQLRFLRKQGSLGHESGKSGGDVALQRSKHRRCECEPENCWRNGACLDMLGKRVQKHDRCVELLNSDVFLHFAVSSGGNQREEHGILMLC